MLELKKKLEICRLKLIGDPDGYVVGNIAGSISNIDCPSGHWLTFFELANGGRFGEIDLWGFEELNNNQYYCEDLPGGENEWLIIGQVLYEPLAISKTSGLVVLFVRCAEPQTLGTTAQFMNDYVFGPRYAELIPDVETSKWWQLLCSEGLVTK
jgi:hypothetical protein